MIRRFVALLFLSSLAFAETSPEHAKLTDRLKAASVMELTDCRSHADDLLNPQEPTLNDADWTAAKRGDSWDAAPRWYRCSVVIPERVGGLSTRGAKVWIDGGAG